MQCRKKHSGRANNTTGRSINQIGIGVDNLFFTCFVYPSTHHMAAQLLVRHLAYRRKDYEDPSLIKTPIISRIEERGSKLEIAFGVVT